MSRIFGPVPSRRLGRSLGIDLIPFKTCTYDCIYCQLGRTTCRTLERREWFPLDEIVAELRDRLSSKPDYITLAGSGEPTLYARIGELIDRIRSMTDIPVAVLTNGSLLWREEIRRELLGADLVIPSLDAGDEVMFRAVNRPHPGIAFETMLDGLAAFRREYHGEYALEVFLLASHTGIREEVAKIRRCVERIRPGRVQLNTAVRPPAEDYAAAVTPERLETLAGMFDPRAEVIADFRNVHGEPEFRGGREQVIELLRRRPCTADDVAAGLGMHVTEAIKYLEELTREDLATLVSGHHAGRIVYRAVRVCPTARGKDTSSQGGR